MMIISSYLRREVINFTCMEMNAMRLLTAGSLSYDDSSAQRLGIEHNAGLSDTISPPKPGV